MVVIFPENPPYSRKLRAMLEPLLPAGCVWRTIEEPDGLAALAGEKLLFAVALDGVAVIVHPSNPVSGLTLAQLEQVFTGQVDNWSALGGPDAPVAVYGREAGSGTRGAFEELLGVTDRCDYTNEYGSSGDVVGNVSGNPNAIGYTSLASVGSTVSALAVEGAACTEETVRSGAYPIQRPFLLVTRGGEALSPAAQAFLDYACGGEAGPYIARAGAVAP